MMDVAASVWKPWWSALPPNARSIAEQVSLAHTVGAGTVAIKGVQNSSLYGARENMIWPGKQYSNDDFEAEVKLQQKRLGIWGWTDLADPAGNAAVWRRAVTRWQPAWCKIDGEGTTFGANAWQTGTFLRSLGRPTLYDGTVVPFYLQSYYMPHYHMDVAWSKWLSYKDANGEYIIAGVAPQAYPIQSQDFVGKYKVMLEDYARLGEQAGRTDFDWHVTLPVFTEGGWKPEVSALEDGILFLKEELGSRLVGIDYWRLWFLFKPGFEGILGMLAGLDLGDEPEPPPPPTGPKPKVVVEYQRDDVEIQLREVA